MLKFVENGLVGEGPKRDILKMGQGQMWTRVGFAVSVRSTPPEPCCSRNLTYVYARLPRTLQWEQTEEQEEKTATYYNVHSECVKW